MSKDRFAARMSAQGYQRPGERAACRNCAHAVEVALGTRRFTPWPPLDCRLGGFLVAPMGICPQHAPIPALRTTGD